jgi:hypothetical protein
VKPIDGFILASAIQSVTVTRPTLTFVFPA